MLPQIGDRALAPKPCDYRCPAAYAGQDRISKPFQPRGSRCCTIRHVAREDDAPEYLSERKRVQRAGDAMLRPAAPWTPAVHALLRHLEMVGFAGAPRVVGAGIDRTGQEMVEFVPGDVAHDRIWSEEGVHQLGRMLRDLHEAAASFRPPPQAVWQNSFLRSSGPGTVISHGDVAPWNVVVRQGQPVALIDWELAGPVDHLNELAHTGWLNARLFDEGVEDVPDLPSVEQRIHQLRIFADGYELPARSRRELARRVVDVAILSAASDAVEAKITAESSEAGWLAWGVAWRARSAAWLVRHRDLLDRALR
jgi:Phosphotransferase enzyme family